VWGYTRTGKSRGNVESTAAVVITGEAGSKQITQEREGVDIRGCRRVDNEQRICQASKRRGK
jgi:hypothetical protein